VELRHLRDFVAVAEELSFTRAAQKLHVAQPSLTVQIKLLEEELEVRLLDRGKGRVSLTDEGRSFLADAKRVLALSAESVKAVRHRNPRETEQLKIGNVASLHYTYSLRHWTRFTGRIQMSR
jgi:DNA-binding transcriptional LysR family regulator